MANENEDIISLQDLVNETGSQTIAGAPVPGATGETAPSDSAPAPAAAESEPAPTSEEYQKIDALFESVDPEFAAAMSELKNTPLPEDGGEIDIESVDLNEMVKEGGAKKAKLKDVLIGIWTSYRERIAAVRNDWRRALNGARDFVKAKLSEFTKFLGEKAKAGAVHAGQFIKQAAIAFWALPKKSKALVGAVIILGVVLFMVLRITFVGSFYPRLDTDFIYSFETIADEAFTYDPNGPTEDFDNPLLHPEHVVLIERLIVNLKQPGDGSSPMGLFEIYLETSNRDSAIEVKDREGEARDIISRTLEQMSYESLMTFQGKNKLKIIMRKNLNGFVTKGQIRRVYFKNIVLKP